MNIQIGDLVYWEEKVIIGRCVKGSTWPIVKFSGIAKNVGSARTLVLTDAGERFPLTRKLNKVQPAGGKG